MLTVNRKALGVKVCGTALNWTVMNTVIKVSRLL